MDDIFVTNKRCKRNIQRNDTRAIYNEL